VPKLWNETIEGHRRSVTDAIIGTTAKIVAAHGLASVTMSDELASYALHALSAASSLTSKAAVRRLVKVTLAGLRAPP
jgi:hypothetical protein